LTLGRSTCGNLDVSHRREWLVTNGIGGYASGTVSGLNTRRYHGVLVAALHPPVGRTLLVSKLDATVAYRGVRYPLSCNEFRDGTIDPHGYTHLDTFALEGLIPVWRYALSDALVDVRVWMAHERNTTYTTFSLSRGSAPIELTMWPLCTYRDLHGHTQGGWEPGRRPILGGFELTAFDGARPYRVVADRADFEDRPD
jgi:predicted glycogen debranching enzyme